METPGISCTLLILDWFCIVVANNFRECCHISIFSIIGIAQYALKKDQIFGVSTPFYLYTIS
jgi:hypothetical protein